VVQLEARGLLSRLPAAELKALREAAQQRSFEAGREIFKEGDPGDGVYFVQEGRVEISVSVGPNKRQVFSQIEPGDAFGEMAVIEGEPRSACAIARAKTSVLFVPRTEMLALLERSPSLALALLREISQRLRVFDRQYLREILQAERLSVVGRFARSIIHDLKNPLNVIGLTAELAGMDQVTPEVRRQAIINIRRQVERITEMVGEILEFTQGSHSEFVAGETDYAGFIEAVAQELREEAALKSVTFIVETPLPEVKLRIHPKRLRRVFFNLVANAAEAMPDGGTVRVRVAANGTEVVTAIEDSGPGIPPEMMSQLFEPFMTHGKSHGTGLGLSICKRIVEDHRGWISARNEPGSGARFSFGIPRPNAAA
jgi:signal transduction histidine kinase